MTAHVRKVTQEPITDEPVWLTRTEVAEILRVTAKTVDRWARQGKITRYHTPGSRPRYRREDVLALRELSFPAGDDRDAQAEAS